MNYKMQSMDDDHSVRILTLNVWGLPDRITNLAKIPKKEKPDRKTRIKNICNHLTEFDIVGFQEVWIKEDKETIIQAGKHVGFNYAHYFKSGFMGSGLLVLSRFPIIEQMYYPFKLNGFVYNFHHGDYMAGKGTGRVTIYHPKSNSRIHVFITHTIAQYSETDPYAAHRMCQSFELGQIVRAYAKGTRSEDLIVVLGDFNVEPHTMEHRLLKRVAKLRDSFIDKEGGHTYIERFAKDKKQERRIDYIMYRTKNTETGWYLSKPARVVMKPGGEKIEKGDTYPVYMYSDHLGVTCSFKVGERKIPYLELEDNSEIRQKALETLAKGIEEADKRKSKHYFRSFISLLIRIFLVFAEHQHWIVSAALGFITWLLPMHMLVEAWLGYYSCNVERNILEQVFSEIDCFFSQKGVQKSEPFRVKDESLQTETNEYGNQKYEKTK